MNIGIYIYEHAEVLDFSGPFEVFSTASRICGGDKPFHTFLIGETQNIISARGGFKVIPDFSLQNHPVLDMLILAGGVHMAQLEQSEVLDWVAQQAERVPLIATVCTGIFILAKALSKLDCQVTTHWEDIADLRLAFPNLDVLEDKRWVDTGKVVSSGGISAGIDMSLYLVSRLHSLALAEKTAHQMEYRWLQSTDKVCDRQSLRPR